jgi:hypothetical protein
LTVLSAAGTLHKIFETCASPKAFFLPLKKSTPPHFVQTTSFGKVLQRRTAFLTQTALCGAVTPHLWLLVEGGMKNSSTEKLARYQKRFVCTKRGGGHGYAFGNLTSFSESRLTFESYQSFGEIIIEPCLNSLQGVQ